MWQQQSVTEEREKKNTETHSESRKVEKTSTSNHKCDWLEAESLETWSVPSREQRAADAHNPLTAAAVHSQSLFPLFLLLFLLFHHHHHRLLLNFRRPSAAKAQWGDTADGFESVALGGEKIREEESRLRGNRKYPERRQDKSLSSSSVLSVRPTPGSSTSSRGSRANVNWRSEMDYGVSGAICALLCGRGRLVQPTGISSMWGNS